MNNQFGANIVYNHTWEDREDIANQLMNMTLVVSSKNAANSQTPDYIDELTMVGVRGSTVEGVDDSLVLDGD